MRLERGSIVLLLTICFGAYATPHAGAREGGGPSTASSPFRGLCSLVHALERATRTDAVVFVGAAQRDTILAGPGRVQHVIAPGHSGRGARRAIFGQLVRAERLERSVDMRLREALTAAGDTVVVVPWDYDASCRPVPWNASARWLTAGRSAVLFAKLRDRADWVDRWPTFDVTPGADSYSPTGYPGAWTKDSILSAEEFLDLYEQLPDYRTLEAYPDSAIAPVMRWQREHPELARKPVARSIVEMLLVDAEQARYRSRPSVLAGSYRVVYYLPSGDSVAFFARTERHPDFVNWSSAANDTQTRPPGERRIVGHGLRAQAAPTASELPAEAAPHGRGYSLQGSIEVLDTPIATGADSVVLSGSVSLDWAAKLLAADTAIGRAVEAAGEQESDISDAQFERTGSGYLGRFVVTRSGRVYFAMRVERAGAHVLSVRAERVSLDVMKPVEP